MIRLALATCRRLPEPDPDEKPLLAALRRLGVEAEMVAWEDRSVDYARFDACVIRSTWNYIHRLEEYLDWARRVSRRTKLLNPFKAVQWNTDKSYLHALELTGVSAVPTALVRRGEERSLRSLAARRGWGEVVVKPRIGAGSYATRRFAPKNFAAGDRFLKRLLRDRDALVQPYLSSVEGHGERSLIWIAGELTHAIRKNPRFSRDEEKVSRAMPIEADERALAVKALKPYAKDLLYARVDLARDERGRPMVMELELVEPSLFLIQSPPALKLFAKRCAEAAS